MFGRLGALLFVVFIGFCLWPDSVAAQAPDPVILTTELERIHLGPHLEILEDKDRLLTIEDVSHPEMAAEFFTSDETVPGLGFTESAYWVRFQVKNESEIADWLLMYDWESFYIDYYVAADNGQGYEVIQTGSALPFDTSHESRAG